MRLPSFSDLALGLIHHLGLVGLGIGSLLGAMAVPGVSEVLLPLGGVAAERGHWSLAAAFAVAYAGQLIGLSIAYVIGRYAGVAVIERYGKYVLISHHDLAKARAAFERRGPVLVLFGSFLPGVQGFVGYIAGIAELPFGQFLGSAAVGKVIWTSGLVGLGYLVGGNLATIDRIVSRIGLAGLGLLVVAVIWYIRRQRARLKLEHPTSK